MRHNTRKGEALYYKEVDDIIIRQLKEIRNPNVEIITIPGNLDTEELKYFREEFTLEELKDWYQELLDRYHKWISYQLAWKKERNESMEGLEFPFEYREGQRKIVSSVYHTISAERQIFIQAPTGGRENHVHDFSGGKSSWCRTGRKHFLPDSKNDHQNSGRRSVF